MAAPEPIITNDRLILAKIETTNGVDAAPTEALNAILVDTLEVTKMQTKTVDRKPVQPFMGAGAKIVTSFDSMIKCKIALAIGANADGVPTVGTTPHYDVLLRICGMQRTTTAVEVSGTAQGGTVKTITLAAGASATDDIYSGLRILTTVTSGAAQAPGVTDLNVIKFKAGDSTTDDFYIGDSVTVQHFAGTIDSASDRISTTKVIYLPSATVAGNNLKGTDIKLTTGSNAPEIRRIISYNATTQRAVLSSPLTVTPTNATTFKITETVEITAYNGTTKIATLQRNLKFATIATTPYSILEARTITDYNGTSKIAAVTPPFSKAPTSSVTYIIGANVTYSLISKAIPTATFYYYEDDYLYAFTGARADLSISGDSGNLLFADITCTGILDRYEVATMPTSTAGYFAAPLPINSENTNALSLHSYDDLELKKLAIGLNNAVAHTDNPGANRVRISARDVKGSVTIAAVRPGDFDFLDTIRNGYSKEFLFSHGPIGNNVTLYCPNTQLNNPKDSDANGTLENTMDMNMPAIKPGNNEIKIILQ